MDLAGYTQALVDYAEQIGDVTPLEDERDALFARLTNGEDEKTLENSSVNGKNMGWKVSLTLAEKFKAFVNAVKIYNGAAGDGPITFIDFSQNNNQSASVQPPGWQWSNY